MFEVKGVPKDTCQYKHDKRSPGIMQAGCVNTWIVVQEYYHYCPFCGLPIEHNPPPKPRLIS